MIMCSLIPHDLEFSVLQENLFNIYVMTNIVIQETLSQIRGNMQVLFKVSERAHMRVRIS